METVSPSGGRLRSAVSEWWRVRAGRDGTIAATRALAREIWDFLRDSTPERRRQHYGDVEFDWDFRVNTTSATVGWHDRLLGVFHSPYQPTEPAVFHEMIAHLPAPLERFTFIDLGSGKGRTLLMASQYPFRRIVGVELIPELHRIAQQNIRDFQSSTQRCTDITSIEVDARTFEFPDEPLVLFLFNPLPEDGLLTVMQKLSRSLERKPREAWILYHNPLLERVIASDQQFQKVCGTSQYVLYLSLARS
jgi:hypothetical protein